MAKMVRTARQMRIEATVTRHFDFRGLSGTFKRVGRDYGYTGWAMTSEGGTVSENANTIVAWGKGTGIG